MLGSSLFIPKFSPRDPRLQFAPPPSELLGFALMQGTAFSPPLRAYDPLTVHEQMAESARTLLASRASLAPTAPLAGDTSPTSVPLQLTMPVQLLWHQSDLGVDCASALARLEPLLPPHMAAALVAARAEGRRVEVRYAKASWAVCVEMAMDHFRSGNVACVGRAVEHT